MKNRMVAAIVITVLTSLTTRLCGQSAYCSDPFSLRPAYMNGVWFTKYLNFKFGEDAAHKPFVLMRKEDVDAIAATGASGGLLEAYSLSANDSGTLRSLVLSDAGDKSALNLSKAISSNIIAFAGLPGSIAVKGFWSFIASQMENRKVRAVALAEVIEAEGQLKRVLFVRDTDEGKLLNEAVVYNVTVMSTKRAYLIDSCTYSLEVDIAEIASVGPLNNKLAKKTSDGWIVVDVDSGQTESKMYEISRDREYIYFSQRDEASLLNLQRVSLSGGPWQRKSGDRWLTLYATTKAR